MTPEIRALAIEARRARATRLRSDAAHDGLEPFHSDDRNEWDPLAMAAGVKLPPYGVPCTVSRMSDWLGKLGISLDDYLAWGGVSLNGKHNNARLSDFIKRNPDWPLKAWVGTVLEWLAHRALMGGG